MKSKNALLRDEADESNVYTFWLTSSPEVARRYLERFDPDELLPAFLFLLFLTVIGLPLVIAPLAAGAVLFAVGLMYKNDLKTALQMEKDQRETAEARPTGARLTHPSEEKQVFLGDDGEFVFPKRKDKS